MTREKTEERASESVFEDGTESTGEKEDGRSAIRRQWWKVAVVLLLVVAVVGIMAGKQKGSPNVPGQSKQVGETLEAARGGEKEKTFPPETVLATVNGEEITLAELESALEEMPEQYRSAFEHDRHGLLDQLITRELLLQAARERGPAGNGDEGTDEGEPEEGAPPSEEELISALLQEEVLEGIEVSEEEVKAFYEKNKDQMPAGGSFEELEDSLRSYARQEKQREAVDTYLKKLREEAVITRNEEWIQAQKGRAADNPLDKALDKGVPVVADFGRDSCVPCKMMKPILEDLKEEYAGRVEILIIQTNEYPAVTRRVGVQAIPTQIFYDAAGNEVDRHQGFISREAIVSKLKEMGVN